MAFGHGANPIFFNKSLNIGYWTSRTLANHAPPLRPITSHFCLAPPFPLQSGRHLCITPTGIYCPEQKILKIHKRSLKYKILEEEFSNSS